MQWQYRGNESEPTLGLLAPVSQPDRQSGTNFPTGLITSLETGTGINPLRPSESLAAIIHDACTMIASLELYTEMLSVPGVLTTSFRHYAGELRLVVAGSRRLLEKLESAWGSAKQDQMPQIQASHPAPAPSGMLPAGDFSPSLAEEVLANHSLIAALVGPQITVGLSLYGGKRPVRIKPEDLTRIFVNLARNSAAAMPNGGHIQIALEESFDRLSLSFADSGAGIAEPLLEAIFEAGYTTYPNLSQSSLSQSNPAQSNPAHSGRHRGLGLAIVRSIVAAAGGLVWASNRVGHPAASQGTAPAGAVIHLEFPMIG